MQEFEIKIRKGEQKDLETLVSFQMKLAFETEDETLDEAILTKGVQAVISDPSIGYYVVVEVDDKVVACTLATEEWSDWSNKKVMWIASVYVREDWRGKGIFKELFNYLKHEVEQSDAHKGIRLYANKQNDNALAVYRALGMDDNHNTMFEWIKND